jgi:hypothetical protein
VEQTRSPEPSWPRRCESPALVSWPDVTLASNASGTAARPIALTISLSSTTHPGSRFIGGNPKKSGHKGIGGISGDLVICTQLLDFAGAHDSDAIAQSDGLGLIVRHIDCSDLEAV